jgi:quercetin dioxygenase-like cupin family protein
MQTVRYLRLYADAMENLTSRTSKWNLSPRTSHHQPHRSTYLTSSPGKQFGLVQCPAGWFGDWHPTPRRQFIIYLSGEMDYEASDGEVRRLTPGNFVLLEDNVWEEPL